MGMGKLKGWRQYVGMRQFMHISLILTLGINKKGPPHGRPL